MPKLYLSHKKNCEVYVSSKDVVQLKNYHLNGIRSIYGTYLQKFKGTILNYKHVKPAIVVYSFLSAMKNIGGIKLPILIICSEKNMCAWNYHMSKLSAVKILSSNSDRSIFDTNDTVILCTIENLKALKPFGGHSWSFVIIDDIDLIAAKMIIKQVSGNFNIALTTKDFTGDGNDYKTKWHILNWTNPKLFGKVNEFETFDKLHYENLRNPYDDIWHDIDMNIDDDMMDQLENDEMEYEKLLDLRGSSNGNSRNHRSSKSNVRKRKSDSKNDTQEKKRGKRGNSKDNCDTRDETKSSNEEEVLEKTADNNRNLSRYKRKTVSFVESVAKKRMLEKRSQSSSVLETSSKDLFDNAWVEGFMIDLKIPDDFMTSIVFSKAANQKTIQEVPADKAENCSPKPKQNTETKDEITAKSDNLVISPAQKLLVDKTEIDSAKPIQHTKPIDEITPKRDRLVINPLADILRDISKDLFDDLPEFPELENIETNPHTSDVSSDDENPIITAIIRGSPLKDALKKEESKSPKRRIKMRDFKETENVETPVKANDFLKSLFGDGAVIIEDEPAVFGEERSRSSPYIRVKGVQEINEYTSSQNFKNSFDSLEEALSCSQRSHLMSTLFDV